jgi:hypothetical protein
MTYVVGASFANVQHSFDCPMILQAFAISSEQTAKLENIKTKEDLNNSELQANLFDLSVIQHEISRFKKCVLKSKVILIPKKDRKKFDNPSSFIFKSYLMTLESLRSENPLFASEGFEKCFLHVPLDQEAKELPVGLGFFNDPLSKYNVKFQKHPDCNSILELARLAVWCENLNLLRRQQPFINKQIRENVNFHFFQVYKTVWNSPLLESYSNNFVGYPRLILKSRNGTEDLIIKSGQTINLFPIVRACLGVEDEFMVPRCNLSSTKHPFGSLLENGKEKCQTCLDASRGTDCLYQRAKCNGTNLSCQNRKFSNDVCHADFCIYMTLYDNKLKVGRSIESRVVGRLLEQGAFDALVFYPIPELPFADYLEVQLAKMLVENLPIPGISKIERIGERVTSKERFGHISSVYRKKPSYEERTKIYDKVIAFMGSLKNNEAAYLLSVERKKLRFGKNWLLPAEQNFEHLESNLRFHHIKGKIMGFAGPFVIIDEKAYDFSKLEGIVVGIPIQ